MREPERTIACGYRRFLRSWLSDPFAVGAVAPSGRSLARMMTREICAGSRVLELGPGTGTVTREILARGVSEQDLFLLERCPDFANQLERDFPAATIVRGDATLPRKILAPYRGSIDFVVSGLPLILFSRFQKERLLAESFALLRHTGAFYQFTYGGRCPVDRRELDGQGLTARCIGFIALNMPPAFVFRITRNGASP